MREKWFHLDLLAALLLSFSLAPSAIGQSTSGNAETYDVVVYGASSAGVIAAVQAARMGKRVALISPREHIGGLSSSGLGWTDTGNKEAIGGISREFYQRVKQRYDRESCWTYEEQDDYGLYNPGADAIWAFEPHVAESVFDTMVAEAGVEVIRGERLDRKDGVVVKKGDITSIETLNGRVVRAEIFVDATYVGDLLAAAGVSYTVGREPNDRYNENWNGVQKDARHHKHFFFDHVSPYRESGNPNSGLAPRVHGGDPGENGEGDHRVQAYNFRICMTRVDANKVDWPKPEGYDPSQYELLFRAFENDAFRGGGTHDLHDVLKIDMIPNRKTDTNNRGAFSTDNIGMNYEFPDGSYKKRRKIRREHERYQKGLLWTLAHHPRIPERVRNQTQNWGLAADEFDENGNWPYMLYIREGRRMIGQYVMTEHDVIGKRITPKSVGLGSYTMDSHNVQRYVTEEGYVQNEGDIGVKPPSPYEIAYGSLVPKEDEIQNLLVPVSVSASHIAFGSIRMEPVFMILGQSAGTAAVHAIQEDTAVQNVEYERLKKQLKENGQKLHFSDQPRVTELDGTVVDDEDASFVGNWPRSTAKEHFVGLQYRHDGKSKKGEKHVTFSTSLEPGEYTVRLAYSPHENRATQVPVTIHHHGDKETVHINQKETPGHDDLFTTLGTFSFSGTARVDVRTGGTDGYVIADAVQFLPED